MDIRINTSLFENLRRLKFVFLTAVLFSLVAACEDDDKNDQKDQYDQIQPKGNKPEWGPTITPQMQTVIETLDSLNSVPLNTLSPEEARKKPTPADAAMIVMEKYNITPPAMQVDTMGVEIPVEGGKIHARVYTPQTGKSSYPMIVYYHGGGWVIATIDTYDASAKALAHMTDAIVVSIEYRKGPEHKFPTAHHDSFMAYQWALENASTLKGDVTRIATAGESAGGNLAMAVAMMARDSSITTPLHILSVYPIADDDVNSASYVEYADAKPLNKPLMQWFFMHYLNDMSEGSNPLISLVEADFSGLPPTTIINAEIDPLESEGGLLAERLDAAGVEVERKLYKGVVHEFFGMAPVVPEAMEAQELATSRLKSAFSAR